MDSSDGAVVYETHRAAYCVSDFISRYHTRFPLLAIVTQGYLGQSESETFASQEILRLHSVETSSRVKAKITDDHKKQFHHVKVLSLPLCSKPEIYVKTHKGKTKSVAELALKRKFPCTVKLTEPHQINLQGQGSICLDSSVSLVLEEETKLRFIYGNPVVGVELLNHVVTLPEYIEDVRLACVTGIEGLDTEQWCHLQSYMSEVVDQYVLFEQQSRMEGIIVHSEEFQSIFSMQNIDNKQNKQSLEIVDTTTEIVKVKKPKEDEHIYAVIPDQNCEYLSTLSKEWKQRLNIDDQQISSGQDESKYVRSKEEQLHIDPVSSVLKKNPVTAKTLPVKSLKSLGKSRSVQRSKQDGLSLDRNYPSSKFQKKDGLMIECETDVKASCTLEGMTICDIGKVLKQLNLGDYVKVFAEYLVDGIILKEFDVKSLMEDFGFKTVEAIRLMKYIQFGHIPK